MVFLRQCLTKFNFNLTSVIIRLTSLKMYRHVLVDLNRAALTRFNIKVMLVPILLFHGNEMHISIDSEAMLSRC